MQMFPEISTQLSIYANDSQSCVNKILASLPFAVVIFISGHTVIFLTAFGLHLFPTKQDVRFKEIECSTVALYILYHDANKTVF